MRFSQQAALTREIPPLPPLALHHFGSSQGRLRLGNAKKNKIFLAAPLALRYFGFAQDRLRLGNAKKNEIFLAAPLALRYLCHTETTNS